MIYLTCFVAEELLKKKKKVSPDLGITFVSPIYRNEEVVLCGEEVPFEVIKYVATKKRYSVFVFEKGELKPIQLFSEKTNLFYKLVTYKPNTAPTIQISGTHMHRVVNSDPWKDAMEKVKLIAPKSNETGLDSCTGLGYSAIISARKCKKIITVEKDENVIEIAKMNPWSRELFRAKNIELMMDEIQNAVKRFKEQSFDFILHDPPQFYHAKELYSRPLYKEFYRVLKVNGRLFHYVGKVGTRTGRRYIEQIKQRLKETGFLPKWSERTMGFLCWRRD